MSSDNFKVTGLQTTMQTKGIKVIALQSLEDYLEMILMLSKTQEFIRAVDLAKNLNYTKASVSVAVKKLKDEGLINIDENNHLSLTEQGFQIAKKVYEKHLILTKFFISLGISKENAEKDACAIEHIISEETFEKIKIKINEKDK